MFCPQINMSEESIKMEERGEFNLESATMSTENLSDTGTIHTSKLKKLSMRNSHGQFVNLSDIGMTHTRKIGHVNLSDIGTDHTRK